jgi:hypothetical protein
MEDSGSSLDGVLDNLDFQDSSKLDENLFDSFGQSPQSKLGSVAQSMSATHRVSEIGVWVAAAEEKSHEGM